MKPVASGLDNLVLSNFIQVKNARLGLVANQAAITLDYSHACDLLFTHAQLKKLFAPEHGFRGELQDMATIKDARDPKTKLPIVSLYGTTEESLAPTEAALKDLDILIVDLQDVGSRYYTFAQTLGLVMQVAKKANCKVMLLDRPNPINGLDVEGSALLKSCRSFCGYAPVPNRHGLTMGELALMMNRGFGEGKNAIPAIDCDLEIIPMLGWKRAMYYDETGLPWVFPSPNMPTLETAVVYPGACLFEATQASEGRGTTRPFELLGAPYIDPDAWIEETYKQEVNLRGATLRPAHFQPTFQKHAGKFCAGIQIHVHDRKTFKSYTWALALIAALAKLYPKEFKWRADAYEFVRDVPAIDLLYGSSKFREAVSGKHDLGELCQENKVFEEQFLIDRAPFLLYR